MANALNQLDTENADVNLTSQVTVLTHTPSVSEALQCQGIIFFGDGAKNLDGSGGDFEVSITIGGVVLEPDPQVVTFSTAVRSTVFTSSFPVPANKQVILKVKSPNVADTDVDVTAYLYQVPSISLSEMKNFDPANDTVATVTSVGTCTTNTDMRGTNGAYTGTPPTADAIGTDAASKVLVTPANKLATDITGNVAANNMRGTDNAALATELAKVPKSDSNVIFNTTAINGVADAVLGRAVSNVENTADVYSLATLILAALNSAVASGTWTIKKTGGTTKTTRTVSSDSNAEPITGITT
jgi:hypothetical protein